MIMTQGKDAIGERGRGLAMTLALPVALAVPLALAGCGEQASSEGGTSGTASAAEPSGETGYTRVVNVEVEELETTAFTRVVRVTGTAEANRDVEVSAEESGVIRELPVKKGSRVRRGQVIARIDDRVLRAQVEQARAQAELARENWERRKRLFEEDKAISELDYLQARYQFEEARARLQSLEERLDRTRIRAPVEGILEERHVEVGSLVSPGSRVARVVDLDPVEISGGVPERYAPEIEPGAPATVRFDVLPDTSFSARLSFVGASIDRESRTFRVELELPNPEGRIKPEMVANVEVVRGTTEDALVVPRGALVRQQDGFVAFVAESASDGDGLVARARPVETGDSRSDRIVIRSGLEAGDVLIVVGQEQVADGDRIRVVGGRSSGAAGTEG